MKNLFIVVSIALTSTSSFALSSAAIIAALKVTAVENITSVEKDKSSFEPRCPCELVQINGTDGQGEAILQRLIVEHLGDGSVHVQNKSRLIRSN